MIDTIFQFLYCPCIYESAWATISIHRTREGAEAAMEAHKGNERDVWEKENKGFEPTHPFDFAKEWKVAEGVILE